MKPTTPSIASQVSRRRFLRNLGIASGCVATGATLMGCEVAEVKVSGGGNATELAFDLADAKFAGLKTVGALLAINVGTKQLLLVRSKTDTVVAVSRMCPHAGCDLSPDQVGSWEAKTETIKCGCHSSRFEPTGKYVANSVNGSGDVADLDSFPVSFDAAAGTGTVDLAGGA